jgi:hypothetical protein
MKEFKGWRDILSWAKENGFERISKRLEINNACWNSSGEFGRSQVAICDAMRFAESEEERMSIAEDIEESLKGDIVIGDSNA